MKLLFQLLCALVVPALVMSIVVPGVVLRNSNYHLWAHYSWVWLHNGQGNQQNVYDLVKGYKDNKIPFGAVNIDSTWATQFNNFEVNKEKFPDFAKLIADLHADNLRVILWATSMVNVENPDYEMCVANNYLVRDVRGKVYPLHWWHGDGGLLDYTNPEAVKWWHSKMDAVLDVGVDGFKCDGTDPYIDEYILTGGAFGYNNTKITYREYADSYYGDFFAYTRERRGDVGLIMSRPTDCLIDPVSKFCTNFSPKNVMYSGWVGDDDATFNGMRGCARKIIFSAWNGYASYGCDVGGYRGQDTPNKQLFIRWAQYGAFLPLMENGGGGEHRPWMYDQETVAIYRKFATEHHRLAPYLMTSTTNAMAAGVSTITPLAERPDIPLYRVQQPSTYNYLLGPDILVHPAMADLPFVNSTFATIVDAQFPEGNEWLDWWQPHDTSLKRSGGSRALLMVPLTSASVFVRRGAMLPLERSADDHSVIFTWFGPSAGQEVQADKLESVTIGTGMRGTGSLTAADESNPSAGSTLFATVSAHLGSGAGIEVVGITEPTSVLVEAGVHTAGCVHRYNERVATLTVFCNSNEVGFKVYAYGVNPTL